MTFVQRRLPRSLDRYRTSAGVSARKAIVSELTKGLRSGTSPEVIARRITRSVTAVTASRALLIARTEMMVAQWDAARQDFSRDPTVTGWQWVARLDGRTCLICRAMHGTVHPKDTRLASHPACRCAMAPVTAFGALPIEPALTGEALFKALSAKEKRALIGDTRYTEYRQTKSLGSMVTTTSSAIWGPGRALTPVAPTTTVTKVA